MLTELVESISNRFVWNWISFMSGLSWPNGFMTFMNLSYHLFFQKIYNNLFCFRRKYCSIKKTNISILTPQERNNKFLFLKIDKNIGKF